MKILETKNCILRPVTLDDYIDLYEYYKIPEVVKFLPIKRHKSYLDTKRFIKSFFISNYEKGKIGHYAIVSKIDNDRYNVKLDIYLNLIGNEKSKSRGAKHILGKTDDDILFIENQVCNTIEKKRAMDSRNRFTYSVYVESI